MTELSDHDKAVLNCVFNPNLPLAECGKTEEIEPLEDVEDDTSEVKRTKQMEIRAIKLAEDGQLEEALVILNRAIEIAPNRASLYNNRAHVYQFQRKFEDAFDSLTRAIELAGDKQKKTLSQALCQRGILYRRNAKIEEARADFEISARLGNTFAKSQLIELNPYAALCNQMLRKVMDTL